MPPIHLLHKSFFKAVGPATWCFSVEHWCSGFGQGNGEVGAIRLFCRFNHCYLAPGLLKKSVHPNICAALSVFYALYQGTIPFHSLWPLSWFSVPSHNSQATFCGCWALWVLFGLLIVTEVWKPLFTMWAGLFGDKKSVFVHFKHFSYL